VALPTYVTPQMEVNVDQNDGRRGDGDIPLTPEQLPTDDGRPTGVRRDRPGDGIWPANERQTHDLARYYTRVCSSLREDDSTLVERYVPIRIFLQNGVNPAVVERAVARLLTVLNVSIEASGEPEIGSWFKSLLGKTQQPATGRMVDETFGTGRSALLLNSHNGDGMDVGIAQAAAAAALIASIKDEPAAAIQIGSILVLKHFDEAGQSQLVVRSLTKRQMMYIEDHPHIMKAPAELIEALNDVCGDDVPTHIDDRSYDWYGHGEDK
jgi:hypothetical protein